MLWYVWLFRTYIQWRRLYKSVIGYFLEHLFIKLACATHVLIHLLRLPPYCLTSVPLIFNACSQISGACSKGLLSNCVRDRFCFVIESAACVGCTCCQVEEIRNSAGRLISDTIRFGKLTVVMAMGSDSVLWFPKIARLSANNNLVTASHLHQWINSESHHAICETMSCIQGGPKKVNHYQLINTVILNPANQATLFSV